MLLEPAAIDEHVNSLSVASLPGVGWKSRQKLGLIGTRPLCVLLLCGGVLVLQMVCLLRYLGRCLH